MHLCVVMEEITPPSPQGGRGCPGGTWAVARLLQELQRGGYSLGGEQGTQNPESLQLRDVTGCGRRGWLWGPASFPLHYGGRICQLHILLHSKNICNYIRISAGPVHPAQLLRGKPIPFCSLTPTGVTVTHIRHRLTAGFVVMGVGPCTEPSARTAYSLCHPCSSWLRSLS